MFQAPPFTRRNALLATSLLVASAGLSRIQPTVAAMQAEDNPLAGTVVTPLSAGVSAVAPDRTLMLLRVTMEPGVEIPPHFHPGPVALYVDAGTFGTQFFEGKGTVTRAAGEGTPAPVIEMAPGDDISMPAGDHLFYEEAVHTMRNDGPEQLVLLVSALFETGAPGFNFVTMDGMDMATPNG